MLAQKIASARGDAQRFGWAKALHIRLCRVAEILCGYTSLKVVVIRPDDLRCRQYLEPCPPYEAGFLDPELLAHAARSHPDLTSKFLEEALPRGDRCFGFRLGSEIAAYGWYSTAPTPVDSELAFHFASEWAYMYKGFTHPEHRGKRLHGIGMSQALHAFGDEGYSGLVSYVGSSNHASRRSCARMGYRVVGTIRSVRLFGRRWVFHTAGCRQYGVRLGPSADARRPEEPVLGPRQRAA